MARSTSTAMRSVTSSAVDGPMGWRAAGGSDIGRIRPRNEDSYALAPEIGCYLIADGLGGLPAGAAASRLAVESALAALRERPDQLREAMIAAQGAVAKAGSQLPSQQGMATTLSILQIGEDNATIAHAGDSRIYVWDGRSLMQRTRDHTAGMDLLEAGAMPLDAVRNSPLWHQLTQAVGLDRALEPQIAPLDIAKAQAFLLCTDGISDMLSDRKMVDIFAAHAGDPSAAIDALLTAAVEAGGEDNATAVVVSRHG